jgi:hypothetical protein
VNEHQSKRVYSKPVSLLLVEGETDEIFYNQIKSRHLCQCRIVIKNLKGLYSINSKVIDTISSYVASRDEYIRVYCCLDRESRYGNVPDFDLQGIKNKIIQCNITGVLSIDTIIATQQLESWFFYDLENIYKFLSVPRSRRNSTAYQPPEKYTYGDLQALFENNKKNYSKGKRSKNFIDHLNIDKIVTDCSDLTNGIELIKRQSDNRKNYLINVV